MTQALTLAEQNGHILPLTDLEKERLLQYEQQIETGMEALFRIKEEGLWREFGSFEAYVASRWDEEHSRRRNQVLAGLRTQEVLVKLLGTGVPNNTEFALRPLVKLAKDNPEKAAEIYQYAVKIASGEAPSHSEILQAKVTILTPEDVKKKEAIDQIKALRFYNDYVVEINNGADPTKILGLVVAYESCEIKVRRAMMRLNVREIGLIRMINDGYARGSETAREVITTEYLQFESHSIKLEKATSRDYRRLLDYHQRERILKSHESNLGKAVSVVVFNGDPKATLDSLRQVLDYVTMMKLADLISLS